MGILANIRHELFCQYIARGRTIDDAYAIAGYAGNATPNADRLRQRPHIHARIAEIMTNAAERVEISASRVLQELGKLAFSNAADYMAIGDNGEATVTLEALTRDQAAAISEIHTETDANGKTRSRVKLASKTENLKLLAQHLGLLVERHEHGQPGDFSQVESTADLIAKVRLELGDTEANAFEALLQPSPPVDATRH